MADNAAATNDTVFDWYPVTGFYFQVKVVQSNKIMGDRVDASFKEVSGIELKLDTETIEEGGLNNYAWTVPKAISHANLVLKRGVTTESSALADMVKTSLTSVYSDVIKPVMVLVILMNEKGAPLSAWAFYNAYPVKWSLSDLDSMRNEVAIEEMEFAFAYLKQVPKDKLKTNASDTITSLLSNS